MQNTQQNAPQSRVRVPSDMPLCSPEDAGNMANHFINQYLLYCRCVTAEEAVLCLGVLSDRVEAVNDGLTSQVQPVDEYDHGHEVIESDAMPAKEEVVREPINKPQGQGRRNKNRRNNRR